MGAAAGSLSLDSLTAWQELSRTSIVLLTVASVLLIVFFRKLQEIASKNKVCVYSDRDRHKFLEPFKFIWIIFNKREKLRNKMTPKSSLCYNF